jgi:hypothetical protein
MTMPWAVIRETYGPDELDAAVMEALRQVKKAAIPVRHLPENQELIKAVCTLQAGLLELAEELNCTDEP